MLQYVMLRYSCCLRLRVTVKNWCALLHLRFRLAVVFHCLKNWNPVLRYAKLFHVILRYVTLCYVWGYTLRQELSHAISLAFPTSCCLNFIAWKSKPKKSRQITTCRSTTMAGGRNWLIEIWKANRTRSESYQQISLAFCQCKIASVYISTFFLYFQASRGKPNKKDWRNLLGISPFSSYIVSQLTEKSYLQIIS